MEDLAPSVLARMQAHAPAVRNGTYTVSHPELGQYTLKLWTSDRENDRGEYPRVVSILTGPDNGRDYTAVAFLNETKTGARAAMFKNVRSTPEDLRPYRNPDGLNWSASWNKTEKKVAVWLSLAQYAPKGYWAQEGYELDVAAHCLRCNAKLTRKESIDLGIGPVCAEKMS